uniref:Multifunctional methyltransferase subunit TRM112-like protein n=1 Tax=Panagrolaimus sp. PS1159 TaxID=55785 RepID=A0AC35F4X7_9BILA
MKLLTHNFLSSSFLKNVKVGYPLILRVSKAEIIESEFNPDFTKRMLQKVEYPVLAEAAKVTNIENLEIPNELPSDWENNETFLNVAYKLLNCINVVEGELECPETGRKFIIRDSIPNMLANEDEVES